MTLRWAGTGQPPGALISPIFQQYEAYLTANVLKPAGMLETGYKAPGWAEARVAHGYRDGEEWGTILDRIQVPEAPYWMLRGNGGLHTTLSDMVAWHRSLSTDAVLPAGARAKFFTPYVAGSPSPATWPICMRPWAATGRSRMSGRRKPA